MPAVLMLLIMLRAMYDALLLLSYHLRMSWKSSEWPDWLPLRCTGAEWKCFRRCAIHLAMEGSVISSGVSVRMSRKPSTRPLSKVLSTCSQAHNLTCMLALDVNAALLDEDPHEYRICDAWHFMRVCSMVYRCSKACIVELQEDILLPLPIDEKVCLLSKNAHHDGRKAALKLWRELPQQVCDAP